MEQTKRFLWAFVAVTALMLAIVPAINLRTDYSRVLHRDFGNTYRTNYENLGYLKAHYLLEHRGDYDKLVFGSSRTHAGFATQDLNELLGGRWYKMEYPGGSQYQHYEYLQWLIDHSFVPKEVIVTIDDFDLWERNFSTRCRTQYNRRMVPMSMRETIEFYWFFLYKNPGEDELEILRGEVSLTPSARVVADGLGQPIPADEDSIAHYRKLRRLGPYRGGMVGQRYEYGESLEYLRRFVRLCDEHNIRLSIVYLPSHPKTLFMRNHKDVQSFKQELVAFHDFYDFTGVFPVTKNNSYWSETNHFRTPLGRAIVEAVAKDDARTGLFGTRVTNENLRGHLRAVARNIREAQEKRHKAAGRDKGGRSPRERRGRDVGG